MRRRSGFGAWLIVRAVAAVVVLVLFVAGPVPAGDFPRKAVVKAVIDGDTIVLDTGDKVRYLGIDCPELAHEGNPADCFGPRAAERNAELVLHRKISLKYDRERVDRYGRLLAYVFLPDGRCANEELLRSGHACVYRPDGGFRREGEYIALQREAVRNREGMWGACEPKPVEFYTGNRRSFVFHRPDCPLGRDTVRPNRVRFQTRREPLEMGYRPCRECKP